MAALFRPPIHRTATAVLDRALFSKIVPIAAARVADKKHISKCRTQLEKTKELLRLDCVTSIRDDPDTTLAAAGGKCLLLRPEVNPDDPTTWSPMLHEAVATRELGVIPFNLHLDYDHWNYLEIMKAILPEDSQGEIPVGFSIVGHVAHLNLRSAYYPYKHLIASILLDKNPTVRTVINKTLSIDDDDNDSTTTSSSIYRTFAYEVLAGPDDLDVRVREADCVFHFDYGRVYWNTRLATEHKRLVDAFQPGEVVVDVMAGVGPFAVPAGKKGVWVWANDLNPDSYTALAEAVRRNKVEPFVRPFNLDGHAFIRHAAADLLRLHATGENIIAIPSKAGKRSRRSSERHTGGKSTTSTQPSASQSDDSPPPTEGTTRLLTIPATISHFVMNLPGSALSFLPAFHGLYAGHAQLFAPHTATLLPMIHVHCFSTKSDDNVREGRDICERISGLLGVRVVPKGAEVSRGGEGGDVGGAGGGQGMAGGVSTEEVKQDSEEETIEVEIHDVRDVAPLKRMFCASFRLPRSVAFASTERPIGKAEVEAKVEAKVGLNE